MQIPSSILILSILSLTLAGCNRTAPEAAPAAPPLTAVRVTQATASDVPLEITAIGNVEAISTVDVKARVTAPVLHVHFAEGQDVKQGELLFELDPESLNRQIAEMDANIAKDIALERQSDANIARDVATLKNLDAVALRSANLLKEGILSRELAEQASSGAEAARASVESDRAALESAKASEKADRAKLQQIRLQLDYTKVYAPISGRAGSIAIKQGSLAKENDNTLVTLLQTAPVYVSFPVPENLLPNIRQFNAAHPINITAIMADQQTSTGTLQFIDNSVDSTTGTIRLKGTFSNGDRKLWPGQFVNVRARLSVENNRILISSQVIQSGPEGKFVWIYNPGDSTVAMRPVTVLRNYTPPGEGEKAVIGAGLVAGENVISEGQLRLTPQAKVRLLSQGAQ